MIKKVYCKNCKYFFGNGMGGCSHPSTFKSSYRRKVESMGCPSILNKNNDCKLYDEGNFLDRLGRVLFGS